MDNSESRLQDVFFYGLYMDPDILRDKGVQARNPRVGVARGYRLRVGQRATLLREPAAEAHGLVYALTHAELNALYSGPGLDDYVAEALIIELQDQQLIAALCCNLLQPPAADEHNPGYRDKLLDCMVGLGLPVPVDL